jgi:hypothetical protein
MIRRHGSRPTLALWMLVAIADVALLVAAIGTLAVLVTVFGLFVLAAGFLGIRMMQRRAVPEREAVLRRRA